MWTLVEAEDSIATSVARPSSRVATVDQLYFCMTKRLGKSTSHVTEAVKRIWESETSGDRKWEMIRDGFTGPTESVLG